MTDRQIYLTDNDRKRLEELLAVAATFNYRDRNDLKTLASELQRAKVVGSREVSARIVTMNSRVKLRDLDTKAEMELTLAFPSEADVDAGKISVLSPVGTAILGYGEGDTVIWTVPAGTRRLMIEKILYQPEAAGDFHL
ncbi:MAG: nucleoside diphosphate kinase regulator [Kiritimatiellae bacterium]|nr:nucleoside diphosphate kinase regulator [Kiritimatiellia bacterium]